MGRHKKVRPKQGEGIDQQGRVRVVPKYRTRFERSRGMKGAYEINLAHTDKYKAKVKELYNELLNGGVPDEMFATLVVEEPTLTKEKWIALLNQVRNYAEDQFYKDREYTFQLHMNRYEKMFEKAIDMVDFNGIPLDPRQHWTLMIGKYATALKALKAKEDLIGLHDKSVVIEFADDKAVIVNHNDPPAGGRDGIPGYDFDCLTLQEQVELLNYIKACRTVPIEGIQRVVVKTTKVEINGQDVTSRVDIQKIDNVETHDITFEEMPKDVVSDFEHIPDEEEQVEPESGIILIDSRPKNIQSRSAEEVAEKLNQGLLQAFKDKLKKQKSS